VPGGYPTNPKTVGEHLKRRRMDLGIRQKDLACELGVSPWTLRLWEAGGTSPEIRLWPGIIRFLGYDPNPEPSSVSEKLKAIRRGLGWSQRKLAGVLGVDPTTVGRWEQGKGWPEKQLGRQLEGLPDLISVDG